MSTDAATDASTTAPDASTQNTPAQGAPSAGSALVTGASTGIGEATARTLAAQGWTVYALARRADRLATLAQETGCIPLAADIAEPADVERVLHTIAERGGIDTLVNVAGGARGADPVAEAKDGDWAWMYEVNVLGTMRLIRAFLPMLRAHGRGQIATVTSTAALTSYEGGGGYNAAKAGERALIKALRLEEAENNIRVIEVLPGLVKTEEFSLRRLGSEAAAQKVYAGVAEPLTGQDVADVLVYAMSLPHHINLDEIVMRPVAQAAQHKLIRTTE